jgi:hypothetical protein
MQTEHERNEEIERLWSDITALYRELPATERRHDNDAVARRRLLMESLSAKLRRMEALIILNRKLHAAGEVAA